MTAENQKAKDLLTTVGAGIQDFLIEMLGNLVPGMLFTLAAAITLGWTVYSTCWLVGPLTPNGSTVTQVTIPGKNTITDSKSPGSPESSEIAGSIPHALDQLAAVMIHKAPWDFITENAWAILIFLLALSYATGCVLFRIDVKRPDFMSAQYMMRTDSSSREDGAVRPEPEEPSNREDGTVRPEPEGPSKTEAALPQRLYIRACDKRRYYRRRLKQILWSGNAPQTRSEPDRELTPKDVQFPYLFLREYLSHRSLYHLAKRIPWSGHDPSEASRDQRSKMFLNILKLRLQFLMPNKCRAIVRNEAHVRLVSSFWYAARGLKWISVVAIFLIFLLAVFIRRTWPDVCQPELASLFGWDLILIMFCVFVQSRIKKFFHYQRVREIIDVLETSHFASEHGHNVFQNLWSLYLEWVPADGGPGWKTVITDTNETLGQAVAKWRARLSSQGVTLVFAELNGKKATSAAEKARLTRPGLFLETEQIVAVEKVQPPSTSPSPGAKGAPVINEDTVIQALDKAVADLQRSQSSLDWLPY